MTAYGGELRYTVRFEPLQRFLLTSGHPDVVLQGNGIFLEHYSQTEILPRVPQTVAVTFREVCFVFHEAVFTEFSTHSIFSNCFFPPSLWPLVFMAAH